MTPQEVVNQITIGQVVAWTAFICGIIGAVIFVTIKLYKLFEKYHKIKEKSAVQENLLNAHDEDIKSLKLDVQRVDKKQDLQLEVMLKQISHEIVTSCEEALVSGSISFDSLESLSGLYGIYHDVYKKNSYVTALMDRVKDLPVVK